ncbi:MAG: diphthamide biosynthesis enzyme Dph2 [Candidatus Aenigmarchaeota archaeon]|nr:diphthamide biosynthesis enzyme Dph2 [Candidatus Aenigmarchaeota archaeon]
MVSRESLEELKNTKAKRIMLQVPEGLKMRIPDIVSILEKEGYEVFSSVEPCFGACDIRDREAKMLGCDAILHIGHSDFGLKTAVPVIYDEWSSDFNPTDILVNNIEKIKFRKIGLLASVQFINSLKIAKMFLDEAGKKAFIGSAGRLSPGQVLGCDYSSARKVAKDVECFLFIGSGKFHSDGLLNTEGKTVFYIDAENNLFSRIEPETEKNEVKRLMRIESARGKKRFAVFVSAKPGQMDHSSAVRIGKFLKSAGKDVIIITADMLTPEKIMGMGLEVIVNTACPRMYDDQKLFGVTVLNAKDAEEI